MAVNASSAQPGDLVEVNVKGRRFFAEVVGRPFRQDGRGVVVPIDPTEINNGRAISYREARGRDVVALYRRLGRARGEA